MLDYDQEKNLFDEESISQLQTNKDQANIPQEEDEEELDNAIEVLVSEKKVWEAAFHAAKLEIEEKNSEIESLKKLLIERNQLEMQKEYNRNCNLLKGPFESKIDSNKAVVNSDSTSKISKSPEDYIFEEFINIALEETQILDDGDEFVSKLESSGDIEDAYRLIFRSFVELSLNNISQEQRIESLNEELNATQEAVQNLHKTIQDSQNSSKLVSVAYTSQIKSLQEDLLNACKDIDFWKQQCENLNKTDITSIQNEEVFSETNFQGFDPTEWCNLGSGINTMVQVETSPDSYWWFISF
ncbi:hypothetical protein [Cryptosporidium parvum Iowa II]|uniref:Uncharacterized protein n=2 Tax=Cryptosporidium parvum TaxID=5807 RepID=Q5CSX2_CRYPI|nr:hypothetical protein [Cryptosporidium parvum Iowa II]EAK88480.1 hypothetical protein cgd1_1000 [Cryptosporidium parvum Iowa II]QOY43527.1 Uncharacterized protein CPATCC_0038350 [Cryptosporidium parvum]WKS75999.1 hypothetical protein CPCDC_1g1000 [Cryptosporidium sp. 43IA8]WRK30493.1 Uncharacterized protein cpbgf_1001000 [Cryptosporidium parvum]|eukprot:QOY43527.1 hypothetical protein CPATCC_000320 [Cryptosporidium parvum]